MAESKETNRGPHHLLLLLVFLFCCCRCQIISAQKRIRTLPGFDGQLPFSLETGYLEVDEEKGVEFFYYFIESESNPEDDPLIAWLTGGPGCSAFSGLVFEIGPLSFDLQGYRDGLHSLYYKADSWTQVSNVIFVDSPVGTGFSYSRTAEGYQTSDSQAVHQLATFLYKWLDKHPKFESNPLYIGGDSYSGKIIPILTLEIAIAIESTNAPFNLKGYLAGNPVTDTRYDIDSKVPFAHGTGLISDELYESTKESCAGKSTNPSNVQCANYLSAVDAGTVDTWQRCNGSLSYSYDIPSSLPYHLKVTNKGYPALIYSGDHDLKIPHVGTQDWIRSLNFSIVDDWRPWYVGGQVAGFTRRYSNNLTFATVKGAGHTAPEYKPKECLEMLRRWLYGASL